MSAPSTRARGFALAAARALGAAAPEFCVGHARGAPGLGDGEALGRVAAALVDAAAQARAAAALGRVTPAGLERIHRSWYVAPPLSASPAAAAHLGRAAYAHLVAMEDDADLWAAPAVDGDEAALDREAAPSLDGDEAALDREGSANGGGARQAASHADRARSAASGSSTRQPAGHTDRARSAAPDSGARQAGHDDRARSGAPDSGARQAAGLDDRARSAARHSAGDLERALAALGLRRVALAFVGAPRAGLAQLCARLGEPAASALVTEVRALKTAAQDEIKAAQRALFGGDEGELGGEGGHDRAQTLFFRVGAAWIGPALARDGDELRRAAQRLPRPLGQTLLDAAAAPSSDAERSAALTQLANVLERDL